MKLISILLSVLLAMSPSVMAEPKCDSLRAMKQKAPSLFKSLWAFLSGGDTSIPCGSLFAVYQDLTEGRIEGGRGLEGKKPFDPVAAQANLDAAMRDAETGKRLAELQSTVKDEDLRLFLSAAVLDEDGFDAARDLVVLQLKQRQR
jgi:hypothetical protein